MVSVADAAAGAAKSETMMKRRATIRPSRPITALAMVAAACLLAVGLLVVAFSGAFQPFLLMLNLGVLIVVGYYLLSGLGLRTLPSERAECGERLLDGRPSRSASERLRELEDLRKQQLITEDEYRRKRFEIIESL